MRLYKNLKDKFVSMLIKKLKYVHTKKPLVGLMKKHPQNKDIAKFHKEYDP